MGQKETHIRMEGVTLAYGDFVIQHDLAFDIYRGDIFILMGGSGCGKSTLLRSIDRLNEIILGCRTRGKILMNGEDIYSSTVDIYELRKKVGMVFQKPNPFPKSIFENVAYGPRIHGLAASKTDIEEIVVTSLKKAGLWNEVKDMLNDLDEKKRANICKKIGESIARFHNNDIIHGDITTSNMILVDDQIHFIDFGLGEKNSEIEAKGVDLHVLMEAIESTHSQYSSCFDYVLEGYKKVLKDDTKLVIKKIQEIVKRGRYR